MIHAAGPIGRLFRKIGLRICWGAHECDTMRTLAAELAEATRDQIDAMRTLTAFRRQYHDGTGVVVTEVHKLTREIARLKTAVKDMEGKKRK